MARLLQGAGRWLVCLCLPFGPVLTHRMHAPPVSEPSARPLASIRPIASLDPLQISEYSLKKLARAWPRSRSGIPKWRDVRTDHFALLTDGRASDVRWLCFALEWALDQVSTRLTVDRPSDLRVMAFAEREQFVLYGGMPAAEALYDPARRQIVLSLEAERPSLLAPLVHELAHAVMHARFGTTGAPWVAEGTAELIALRVLGRDLGEWAPWIPSEPSIEALMSVRDILGEDSRARYALAVSWMSFLIEHEGRTYRELIHWSPTTDEVRVLERRWRTSAGGT